MPSSLPVNVRPSSLPTFILDFSFLSVLSRIQNFLPQMEASNALLEQRLQADPKEVDMENIAEEEERYIEMVSCTTLVITDVGITLGVLECRRKLVTV
jgi:hypothetical protein